jgi:hypothetical protein
MQSTELWDLRDSHRRIVARGTKEFCEERLRVYCTEMDCSAWTLEPLELVPVA